MTFILSLECHFPLPVWDWGGGINMCLDLTFQDLPVIYLSSNFVDTCLSFLSFFLYILPGARIRALSAGVHCTLRVAG